MKNLFYFKLEEAENMKEVYSSWIGKEAHTGNGKKQTLIGINIAQRKLHKGFKDKAIYKVQFIFDNQIVLSAYEFLFHNSLVNANELRNETNRAPGSAA